MNSTSQLPRRSRRLIPVIVIVLGLLLISAVMIRQVAAQDGGGLKPPFKLHQNQAAPGFGPNGPVALPLGAPIIMSQTFDSTYSPTPNLNQVGWHESYASGATSQYTWGYVGTAPLPNTVWSARHNPSGFPQLDPATDNYTKGMQALLIFGPLNLSDYLQVVMTGTYWLDAAPGDYFGVAYSTDGTNWDGYAESAADPGLSQEHTFYFSLNPVARKPQVWVALTFTSNDDNLVGRGAFVKDVVLRGNPAIKIFMPLVRLDPTPTPTFTPTPTATPQNVRYGFTFENQASTNPDFNYWGGAQNNSCGTGCAFYQALVTNRGNPGNAFDMWIQGYNGSGGAGPRVNGASLSTATDFEYSADLYMYNGELNARYGLAFDGSSGAFPDSGSPPMSTDSNYYLLELRMDTTTRTDVAMWQLLQVVNGTRNPVTTAANLPVSVNQGEWHNLKVIQIGGTIWCYLDGVYIGQGAFDSVNWNSSRRRFGLYIDIRDSNGDGGPFEYFADNIIVRDR